MPAGSRGSGRASTPLLRGSSNAPCRLSSLPPGVVAPLVPLMFEPGTAWQYGYSADWTGKLVEAVSGLNLEQYFQRNILQPLGMNDTTFVFPKDKFDRLVSQSRRQNGGPLQEAPRTLPGKPAAPTPRFRETGTPASL